MKSKVTERLPVQLDAEQRKIVEALAEKDGTSSAQILQRAIRVGLPKVREALEQLYGGIEHSPIEGGAAVVAEAPARYSARKKGVA